MRITWIGTGIIFLFLISCRKSKEVSNPDKLENRNTKELVDHLLENQKSFSTFFGKFTAKVQANGEKHQFKGSIRMKRDSIIWMSITKLGGVEMVRMVLTLDSIKVINKWDKTYFLGALSNLKEFGGVSVDYFTLQDFLIGQPIQFDPTSKYKSSDKGEWYLLSLKTNSKIRKSTRVIETDSLLSLETIDNKYEKVIQKNEEEDLMVKNYYLLPKSFLLARQSIKIITDQQAVEVTYSDYQLIQDRMFFSLDQVIRIASKNNSSRFDLSYSSVQLDQDLQFPFKISKKYEPFKK
jgi:hypothetical protein